MSKTIPKGRFGTLVMLRQGDPGGAISVGISSIDDFRNAAVIPWVVKQPSVRSYFVSKTQKERAQGHGRPKGKNKYLMEWILHEMERAKGAEKLTHKRLWECAPLMYGEDALKSIPYRDSKDIIIDVSRDDAKKAKQDGSLELVVEVSTEDGPEEYRFAESTVAAYYRDIKKEYARHREE